MGFAEKIDRKDILLPISSKVIPKKFISFDIETYNNNKSFLIGDIYDGKEHKLFYNKEEMKRYFIENKFPNTYIVATNLQFDFTMLYGTEDLWKFDIIQNGGRFISCKYKFHTDTTERNTNVFIDSINFANMSVETAGKLLGIPKIEHPKFLGKKPSTDEEWKEMILYNQRDTEITYKLMELLQKGFNELGGNLKLTISSTALDIFKRKYLKQSLIKESAILKSSSINKKIFESYYGGRTECFARGKIGKGYSSKNTVVMADLNSLYPHVMCNNYPLPQSIKKIIKVNAGNFLFEGISNVIIECPYMKIPLLPYRDKLLKKLIFPVGRWKATYTHVELRKALELGYIVKKINYQYIYTQSFTPFKEFVETVYARRMEYKKENNPLEYVMKITMNCFHKDTNIWTTDGLKNIRDIKVGDEVYSINPKTMNTEIQKVKRVFKYEYDGKMYHIKNTRMDLKVTPNHRFLLTNGSFKEIKDIKKVSIPKICSKISGKNKKYINIKKYLETRDNIKGNIWFPIGYKGMQRYGLKLRYNFKEFIKLIGWYISEGCLYHKNNCEFYKVSIHQQKEYYREEIEKTLKKLGILYRKYPTEFEIYDKALYRFLELEIGHYQKDRKIPRWIYDLDYKYLEILYDTMMKGDGYFGEKKNGNITQSAKYTTNSKQLSKDFQQLCIHIGKHTKVYAEKDKRYNRYYYRIYETTTPNMQLRMNEKRKNIFIENNDNKYVYCIEVNKNHTVIAENDGKMIITGQSLFGKFSTRKFASMNFFNITEMDIDETFEYLNSKTTETYGDIGYTIIDEECDANYVFPILSAYTTAYGRIKLYEYLSKYNVYYCDTDSVVTDEELHYSNKLGDMKREYEIKKGIIIKPKMYQLDVTDKVITKMKGIPRPSIESFNKALSHKAIEYSKFMKLKESIKRKRYVNMVALVQKEVKLEDNKRVWTKGFSPLIFDGDSRPHYINDVTDKYKKIIHRLTYLEKVMNKKDNAYEQVKMLLMKLGKKKTMTFIKD